MWHASCSAGSSTHRERVARAALSGVGGRIVQVDRTPHAVHVRKLLTSSEQRRFGIQVQDIRGTATAAVRAALIKRSVPDRLHPLIDRELSQTPTT